MIVRLPSANVGRSDLRVRLSAIVGYYSDLDRPDETTLILDGDVEFVAVPVAQIDALFERVGEKVRNILIDE